MTEQTTNKEISKIIVDINDDGLEVEYSDGTRIGGIFDLVEEKIEVGRTGGEAHERSKLPTMLRLLACCDPRLDDRNRPNLTGSAAPEEDGGESVGGVMAWWWSTTNYEIRGGELFEDSNTPDVWRKCVAERKAG